MSKTGVGRCQSATASATMGDGFQARLALIEDVRHDAVSDAELEPLFRSPRPTSGCGRRQSGGPLRGGRTTFTVVDPSRDDRMLTVDAIRIGVIGHSFE